MIRFAGSVLVCVLSLAVIPFLAFGQHGIHPNWGPEVLVSNNTNPASGNVGENIAVSSTGEIVLCYNEFLPAGGKDIFITRSSDGGGTWTMPVPFAPADSTGPTSQNASLDYGPDDVVHAVWDVGSPEAVYYSQSADHGVTWSTPVAISGAVRHMLVGPSVTVDRSNRVHVFWHDGNHDDDSTPCSALSQPAEVWHVRSPDGGSTWDAPQMISTDDGCHSAFPRADLCGAMTDNLVVVWRDKRETNGSDWDLYMARSYDGGQTWSEEPAIGGGGMDWEWQWDPIVVVDRSDYFHVLYARMPFPPAQFDSAKVVYSRSTDLGSSWSPEVELGELWSNLPYMRYDFTNDNIWSAWQDVPERDARGSLTTNGGLDWSPIEWVTDCGDSSIRFEAYAIDATGEVLATYSYGNPYVNGGIESIFFRRRVSPTTSAPEIFPGGALHSQRLILEAPEPNPSVGPATVRFGLAEKGHVLLRVFDCNGRAVATLADDVFPAGFHTVRWDWRARAAPMGSGVYFLYLEALGEVRQRKYVFVQ